MVSDYGSYDGGYLMPSGPITHDGQIWIYYTGLSGVHSANPTRLGERCVMTINLATTPEDRWAGLLAGPNQGRIITRPIIFKGSKLLIDVDASVPAEDVVVDPPPGGPEDQDRAHPGGLQLRRRRGRRARVAARQPQAGDGGDGRRVQLKLRGRYGLVELVEPHHVAGRSDE